MEGEPLSTDELSAFTRAADDMAAGYRLVGHVLPFTGMIPNEFRHLRRSWIHPYDLASTNFQEADQLVIRIPEDSPCTGGLKFTEENSERLGLDMERRDSPCHHCSPNERWYAPSENRQRRIPVKQSITLQTLKWWFNRYDSIPCSWGISNRVKRIAREAGIDRADDLTAYSLRYSFGVVLLKSGISIETVVGIMGYARKERLKPLLEYTDRSLDRNYGGRIPESDLLEELHRLSRALHRAPKVREMRKRGAYSVPTYIKRFGGWNEALLAAGMDPQNKSRKFISEEELIDDLRRLADELGREPRAVEIQEMGCHDPTTYTRRFGDLEAARKMAFHRS